jgi:Flp pilus assembly protein TadB
VSEAPLAQLKAGSNKSSRGLSVLNEFNRLKQKLSETFAALSKSNQTLIIAVCTILVMYLFFWIVDKIFVYVLARSYVSEIADVFNLNTHLAAAASFAVFIMFVYLLSLSFSFSRSRRIIGVIGLAAISAIPLYVPSAFGAMESMARILGWPAQDSRTDGTDHPLGCKNRK